MEKVSIKIDLIGAGSARIDIGDSLNEASIFPSYIFDGLERLLVAIILLNKGLREVECGIFCESPQAMISFIQSDEVIELKVYEFYDWHEKPLKDISNKSRLLFTTQCKLKQLTNQVINAYYHLQEQYGKERYRQMWQNEFPERMLTALQALIKKHK